MTILERLFALQEEKNADFQAKLTPTLPRQCFLGVRMPAQRKLAKEVAKTEEAAAFLRVLPHNYYDENILHALLISEIKDYENCIRETERFLPFVDNWAVCDILSPKCFKKNREKLLGKIREWSGSEETYTCRFGIEMLMSHFLDEDFSADLLEIPAAVRLGEYYVNMMIAWFFATALAKQWEATIPYVENHVLDDWTHRKTIQKACESFRITEEQKVYLRSLK